MSKPKVSFICGVIALVGVVAALAGDLIGIYVVEEHNPVRETISALAAGEHAWIQDLGIDLLAVGVLAAAVGLITLRSGGLSWKLGVAALALLGVDLFLLAEHNQYAYTNSDRGTIHQQCVYAFSFLFGFAALLLGSGLRRLSGGWARHSLLIGVIWFIVGPPYFFLPTSFDGAYERLLALIMLGWTAAVAGALMRRPRELAAA